MANQGGDRHDRTQRLPPNSEEAERGVLGSIMTDGDRVMGLCNDRHLTAEAFYVPAHRIIFDACERLYTSGRILDILAVGEELKADGDIERVGGHTALDRLVDNTPTAAHADYYIDIVDQKWMLRKIIQAARDAEQAAYEAGVEDGEAERIRSEAEYALSEIRAKTSGVRTNSEMLKAFFDRCAKAQETGTAGLKTGIKILDAYWGGLMDGCVYSISGPKKSGKSTLARQIAEYVAVAGDGVAVFTMEIPGDIWIGSLAAKAARQNVFYMLTGNKSQVDLPKAMAESARIASLPLYINDQPHNCAELWSVSRSLKARHGIKLVVVDYLQAIRDGNTRFNGIEDRVSHKSGEMVALAKTLNVPVLLLSSVNKDGELRGSGQVGYDITAGIRITTADSQGIVGVSFTDTRYGPPASDDKLRLVGSLGYFEDVGPDPLTKEEEDFFGGKGKMME